MALTGTESLTVDFKEGAQTATIAECAAAMANAYGGLIFVGITDQGRDIVGVPREAMAHAADVLATHLGRGLAGPYRGFHRSSTEIFEKPRGGGGRCRITVVGGSCSTAWARVR